jgi:hypothetical protein
MVSAIGATVWLLSIAPFASDAGQSAPAGRGQQKPAAQPPRPDQNLIINIPATSPWTDTGISVRAGDRLQIRAWGTANFGDAEGRGVTPRGLERGGGCGFVVTNAAVPAHALVGNIAPQLSFDGQGFLVGTDWESTVPVAGSTTTEGRLFLGFNHEAMLCDRSGYDSWAFRVRNSGAFTAEVAIWRRR